MAARLSDLTDEELKAKLPAAAKQCLSYAGIAATLSKRRDAEANRYAIVKELAKRGLIGYPLKKKYKEVY